MDKNIPPQTPPPANTPPVPQVASPEPPVSPTPDQPVTAYSAPKTPGNNKTIMLLILVVVMALIVGGIYFLAIKAQDTQTAPVAEITPAPQPTTEPTTAPSPTAVPTDEDVNNLDLGNPEEDLKTIEDDLKQL